MLHALKTAFCSVRMKYQKPVASEKLLGALDAVNGKWGWGGMRLASVPVDPSWGIRWEMMTQSFTSRVDDLWTVYCK